MGWVGWTDAVLHELLLFAAVGILVGGVDDLAIDFAYAFRLLGRRWSGAGEGLPCLDDLVPPAVPGRFAVFVPAWDEAAVIGPMLRTALARFVHPDYVIYVGCYPNDAETRAAVAAVAAGDARVRLVVGDGDGPTTKADCLNTLWRALVADDPGRRTRAVVLHDAEDVVHAHEFAVFDALLARHPVVQLPVLPLVRPASPLVAGHYADEFAESHARVLVVRELVGAAMPLAGVGCAIALPVLDAIAAHRGGAPFDPQSLVEDYELGLAAAFAGPGTLARVREAPGREVVAVREYFPATVGAAVRQKARWMHGIALAGWDRTGWARPLALGDHWMRLRDRRGPLAVLVLVAAYLALVLWAVSAAAHHLTGTGVPADRWLDPLLRVNAVLLCWRALVRSLFTARAYGWQEAAWTLPRLVTGNLIAMLAARRALWAYLRTLRGGALRWDKTTHAFPAGLGGTEPA